MWVDNKDAFHMLLGLLWFSVSTTISLLCWKFTHLVMFVHGNEWKGFYTCASAYLYDMVEEKNYSLGLYFLIDNNIIVCFFSSISITDIFIEVYINGFCDR